MFAWWAMDNAPRTCYNVSMYTYDSIHGMVQKVACRVLYLEHETLDDQKSKKISAFRRRGIHMGHIDRYRHWYTLHRTSSSKVLPLPWAADPPMPFPVMVIAIKIKIILVPRAINILLPCVMSPPCIMKPGMTRWMLQPLYLRVRLPSHVKRASHDYHTTWSFLFRLETHHFVAFIKEVPS